jgi:ZIP family zinc transporter
MGFSAGMMVMGAFAALLPNAQAPAPDGIGRGWGFLAFLLGMVGMWLLDVSVPHDYLAERYSKPGRERVFKAGMLAAVGITIHNVPEGIAVFTSGSHDVQLGWAIAAAIALHNIPEGLAVSVPVYAATGSRWKAFGWGTFSGLVEPAGALVTGLALYHFMSPAVVGCALAVAAGLMVYISLDELLPAAQAEGESHPAIIGVIVGMAVMAGGLLLMVK